MKHRRRAAAGSHLDPLALQALVDHEVCPAESLRYARHLADCPDCERTRSRLESMSDDLYSLPGAEVPEGFSQRVMQQVAALPTPRRHARLLRLVAPTAAALLLALAALASPWTVHLARGMGGRLPEVLFGPTELMDLLLAVGAAILAGLARAASSLGPWITGPALGPGSWFHLSGAVLGIGLLAAIAVVGIALAGGGFLVLRGRKAVE